MTPVVPSATPGRQVRTSAPYTVPATTTSPFAPGLPLVTTPEWHLARRVAQAPTFRLAAEIKRLGPQAWLEAQLNHTAISDSEWERVRAAHYSWLDYSYPQVIRASGNRSYYAGGVLAQSLLRRPVLTNRVLFDSMCDFWGDFLFVPWRSKAAAHVLGYDRDVIRKHALGRYADMLRAAVTSPALLVFLDNNVNIAGNPNENLGREILELYSVGRGQFTEQDVQSSSRILTGLGVDDASGTFAFVGEQHAAGPVKVMTFTHPNPRVAGRSAVAPPVVEAYLEHLARHPMTARRIALRLAVRFVSDAPSESLVQALAKVYLDNDTALTPVVRALFAHPEFWGSVGQKWARPREVIGRALRSGNSCEYVPPVPMEVNSWDMGSLAGWYEDAGELPRDAAFVDGYADDQPSWAGTSTLLAVSNALAGVAWRWDRRSADPDWRATLGLTPGAPVIDTARKITLSLTGYSWPDRDLAPIASLLGSGLKRPATPQDRVSDGNLTWDLPEAVHLVLASPYSFLR
ncbi:DUF1800 family protein [Arsenicicoccus dermatophilus]|uniref:DUF1800 family protein n=1 Tax=Arsenicicoccus dermatophilus TaxID=1076331 RepID=UPI001F4C7E51|nr:DUF1800 family protein [Arsenicicoccus dermatophilus]MCH8611652.1 DUF1800 domain-containing protein [Arsenicicoccus dermatophilus]